MARGIIAGIVALIGVIGIAVAGSPPAHASVAAPAVAVAPVTHLAAGSVTASTVKLSWQWPSSSAVVGVTVRMARGSAAPATPAAGSLAGNASRPASTLTVGKLAPRTRYAFAVFARDRAGHFSKAVAVSAVTSPAPLRVATRSLATGTEGLSYVQVLSASGGVAPYTWTASGLPSGLTVSKLGIISGYPRATGNRAVTVKARDTRGVTAQVKLTLSVPTSLPAACIARNCAQLSRDKYTIQVPAADVVSVTRSAMTGNVAQVVVSGISVAAGDILVLPPASGIPSGLVAAVSSVTAGGAGTLTAMVTPASPAAAYYQGVVQTIGTKPKPSASSAAPSARAAAPTLKCSGSVTAEVHGLTVTPDLQPAIALQWKHDLFGKKGVYAGFGGLKLFQFSLTGTITVDMGASVSGKAKCSLTLPTIRSVVPAGYLGAVLLEMHPSATFETTGELDLDTSVTLSCYAGYEWNQGKQTFTDYCSESHHPLALSSSAGVDATLTGAINASASIDDLPGVKGMINASMHAGYHPLQTPVAEIDASSDYELKATLANIWKGAPTVTIAHGTIFSKVLQTWGSAPPSATGSPVISVSPDLAFPWTDAACGYPDPWTGYGSDVFAVQGSGFKPGESVTVWFPWRGGVSYSATASPGGAFTVSDHIGEIPSVLWETFAVQATGNAGSRAASTIELDSNACLAVQSSVDGALTARWGLNGADPNAEADLYIDGTWTASLTTDGLGSGGSQASFTCPDSGSYVWDVDWTVNGEPAHVETPQTFYCTPAAPAATPSRHLPTVDRAPSGGARGAARARAA
jgi:hypothetical protein